MTGDRAVLYGDRNRFPPPGFGRTRSGSAARPVRHDGALRGAVVAFTPSSFDDEEVRVLPELWPLKFE
jgi:hypothetical protein